MTQVSYWPVCINNVNSTDNTNPATLNTGQPHVNEEQNTEQQPQHHFPNQMIEQINIALEQKGQEFLISVGKPAVGDNVRKESIYIN